MRTFFSLIKVTILHLVVVFCTPLLPPHIPLLPTSLIFMFLLVLAFQVNTYFLQTWHTNGLAQAACLKI